MTRRISLIIGVAVAALTVVPAAFGEGRLADSQEPDGVAYFYANERATLAQQDDGSPEPDGVAYFYANERATLAQQDDVSRGDDHARTQQVDFWNYDPQSGAKIADASPGVAPRDLAKLSSAEGIELAGTPATSSGDKLEWLQIGMGLGVGILLALGVFLGLRLMHIRPLAH